ncbi:MAG: hypothetical protein WA637_15735 [Terriglobales bacterium]
MFSGNLSGKNGDVPPRVERQQISIAGHDQVGNWGTLRVDKLWAQSQPRAPAVVIKLLAKAIFQCYTVSVSYKSRLRNVTVTLEEDVAQWARIEAARRDTSVSRLLGELLKERMSTQDGSTAEAADRLANFGKRHKLSLRGLKIKDLINEGRR